MTVNGITYYKPNIVGRAFGQRPHVCKCGCRGNGSSNGLLGQAKGAIKLTLTPDDAVRATAFLKWVSSTRIRTAGGQSVGTNDIVEFIREVAIMPIDVAKKVLQYATTPGLVYTVWNEGKKTKQQIETRMQNDPEFRQKVKDVTEKVLRTGTDVFDIFTGPIKSISTTITWLPYIVIGGLALLALFIFMNPGVGRKVSVF